MDIFRYFHPHHNPRLRNVGLRLQEIAELEQAAQELRRAVMRAEIRSANAPAGPISAKHFSEVRTALDFVIESLDLMSRAHPGDNINTLRSLLEERRGAPGWETWSRLASHRLLIDQPLEDDDIDQDL